MSSNGVAFQGVHWYNPNEGFKTGDVPEMIPLMQFNSKELETLENWKVKSWVWFDRDKRILRGALIMRLTTPIGIFYILEVQRRIDNAENIATDSTPTQMEEKDSMTGLIFTIKSGASGEDVFASLLSNVRRVKGVMKHLEKYYDPGIGEAYAFKHVRSSDRKVAGETAIRNALEKVGVVFVK